MHRRQEILTNGRKSLEYTVFQLPALTTPATTDGENILEGISSGGWDGANQTTHATSLFILSRTLRVDAHRLLVELAC